MHRSNQRKSGDLKGNHWGLKKGGVCARIPDHPINEHGCYDHSRVSGQVGSWNTPSIFKSGHLISRHPSFTLVFVLSWEHWTRPKC